MSFDEVLILVRNLADGTRNLIRFVDEMEKKGEGKRIFHCFYEDFLKDEILMLKKINDYFGYNYNEDSIEPIKEWFSKNPQNRFGTHSYNLEKYGLTEDIVKKEFSEYFERFYPNL